MQKKKTNTKNPKNKNKIKQKNQDKNQKKIIHTKCNRKMERIFIRTDMDKRIHRNMKHTL